MVFFSCLLSTALLVFSFPKVDFFPLAWVALVPLLIVLDGQRPWRAFRRAYLVGFIFFALIVGWLVNVTWIGAICMFAFLALYFGIFGLLFVYFQPLPLLLRILVLSSAWSALEFIRDHLFSGFGWGMLGYSQYKNLYLIQIADIVGVYGISFLIVFVNLVLFEIWKARRILFAPTMTVGGMLLFVFGYGAFVLHHHAVRPTVRIGLVQPNISLAEDWDDSKKDLIVEGTLKLTRTFKGQGLDLIIWPETSLPGVIDDSPELVNQIQATARDLNTPIMIGSIAQEGQSYYNSAFFIDAQGHLRGHYDKIHLVPFGEYLPLRPVLGWINKIIEIDDFTFGSHYKVFSLSPQKNFAVLICYEDTLSGLRRRFVSGGANFLVNMTNDAWFKDTKEPYMHLANAVLGCVESHRSLARAANTGVSALVDPWGHIISTVSDGNGKNTFVEGTTWGEVPLNGEKTFYTKYGDIFTYFCFLCILVAAIRRKQS